MLSRASTHDSRLTPYSSPPLSLLYGVCLYVNRQVRAWLDARVGDVAASAAGGNLAAQIAANRAADESDNAHLARVEGRLRDWGRKLEAGKTTARLAAEARVGEQAARTGELRGMLAAAQEAAGREEAEEAKVASIAEVEDDAVLERRTLHALLDALRAERCVEVEEPADSDSDSDSDGGGGGGGGGNGGSGGGGGEEFDAAGARVLNSDSGSGATAKGRAIISRLHASELARKARADAAARAALLAEATQLLRRAERAAAARAAARDGAAAARREAEAERRRRAAARREAARVAGVERVGRARAAAEAAGLDTLVVTVLGARGLGPLAARGGGKQRRVHLGLARAAGWPAPPAALLDAPEAEVRAWEARADAAAARAEAVGALALAGDAVGAAAAAVAAAAPAVAVTAAAVAVGEEKEEEEGEEEEGSAVNVVEEGDLLDAVDIGGDVPRTAAVDATRDAIGWPDGPQRLELPMGSATDAALLLRLLLEDAPKGDGASAGMSVSTTVASAALSLEAMALAPRQVWGAASGVDGAPPAPPALSFGVRKCWLPLARVGGAGSGGADGAGAAQAAAAALPCGEVEVEVEWVSRRRLAAREGVEEAKRMAEQVATNAALATTAAAAELAAAAAAAGEREAAAEQEGAGESTALKLELEQQKEVRVSRFVLCPPARRVFLFVWCSFAGSQRRWRGTNCALSRAAALALLRTDPTPAPTLAQHPQAADRAAATQSALLANRDKEIQALRKKVQALEAANYAGTEQSAAE